MISKFCKFSGSASNSKTFSWSHELNISQNNFENKIQFLGPYGPITFFSHSISGQFSKTKYQLQIPKWNDLIHFIFSVDFHRKPYCSPSKRQWSIRARYQKSIYPVRWWGPNCTIFRRILKRIHVQRGWQQVILNTYYVLKKYFMMSFTLLF